MLNWKKKERKEREKLLLSSLLTVTVFGETPPFFLLAVTVNDLIFNASYFKTAAFYFLNLLNEEKRVFLKILPCDTGLEITRRFWNGWLQNFSRDEWRFVACKKKINLCQMGAADFRLSTISSHALTLMWHNVLGWSIRFFLSQYACWKMLMFCKLFETYACTCTYYLN